MKLDILNTLRCTVHIAQPTARRCSIMASRSLPYDARDPAHRGFDHQLWPCESCANSRCAAAGRSMKALPSVAAVTSCAPLQILCQARAGPAADGLCQ